MASRSCSRKSGLISVAKLILSPRVDAEPDCGECTNEFKKRCHGIRLAGLQAGFWSATSKGEPIGMAKIERQRSPRQAAKALIIVGAVGTLAFTGISGALAQRDDLYDDSPSNASGIFGDDFPSGEAVFPSGVFGDDHAGGDLNVGGSSGGTIMVGGSGGGISIGGGSGMSGGGGGSGNGAGGGGAHA